MRYAYCINNNNIKEINMSKYSQSSIVHKKSVLQNMKYTHLLPLQRILNIYFLFYIAHDRKLLIKMVPDGAVASFNVKKKEIQLRQVSVGLVCLKTKAGSI